MFQTRNQSSFLLLRWQTFYLAIKKIKAENEKKMRCVTGPMEKEGWVR